MDFFVFMIRCNVRQNGCRSSGFVDAKINCDICQCVSDFDILFHRTNAFWSLQPRTRPTTTIISGKSAGILFIFDITRIMKQ